MRAQVPAALAAVVLAAGPTAAAAQPSTTPNPNEPTGTGRAVVADGHVDLGPRFVDGTWRLQIRDDTVRPVVWRNLSDIVLHAVDPAAVTVPPDPAFSFLGPAGSTVWLLPQTQQAGILWPGWNTQDPSVIGTVSRAATWRLHGVTGPGKFVLFLTGNFGAPQILFDSAKTYPQETGIEVGSHVHGNWVFTASGTYLLDVEISASTTDGGMVTDRQALRIFAGPGDPATAFPTSSSTPAPQVSTAAPAPASSSGAPAPSAAETPAESGTPPWIPIGGGALALLAVAAGVLVWSRRRRVS
jgi:putative ABC transporter-associated repeat protein